MPSFKQVFADKVFLTAIITTCIFMGTGLAFLFMNLVSYSWILFGLLPLALGIAIGTLTARLVMLAVACLATIMILIGIYIPGYSGIICVVMSLGLIIPFICLGYVIVRLVIRYREIKEKNRLPVLLIPLLPFLIAAPAEHYLGGDGKVIEEVKTEKIFNYTPEQVYDAIKSVDTLDAEKPFLLEFDLPIPTKCVLEREEVGGLRTCYFKAGKLSNGEFGGGTITERITELERGKVLRMDVTDCNLNGRKWLGFKEAIYYFEETDRRKCKLTRITTYTSVLSPRFYWRPMERLGIEQEHDYVFNNLEKDLKNKFR